MAEIICNRSGIVFTCSFLPASLKGGEISHPFFSYPRRSLLALAGRWANGDFSPEENYLYFLSLLDSGTRLIWRAPVKFSPETLALMQAHMEPLLKLIERMDNRAMQYADKLPQFTVTKDTASLETIPYFLEKWNDSIDECIKGYKSIADIYAEQEKESAIERLIRNAYRNSDKPLAAKLADWAESAGSFPTFKTLAPNGKHVAINTLWKEIIRACVDDDRVHMIPGKDLEELIEHVIDHIPQGTLQSAKLLQFLRAALNKKTDFDSLGFGSENLAGKTTSFTIVRNSADNARAIRQSMIAQAPSSEPKKSDYASLADYLRAKSRWNMAQSQEPGIAGEVKGMMASLITDDREEEEDAIDPHDPEQFASEEDLND